MIIRVFEVLDTATRMHMMVVQFEEVDKKICDKIGIAPGFKIVNRLSGRSVDCFAGYKFVPGDTYYSPEAQSKSFDPDGTVNAFSLLLSEVDNIKKLPGTINVEVIREYWVRTSRGHFLTPGITEILDDYLGHELRKCLYKYSVSIHLAIIDLDNKEVIYDLGASRNIEEIMPKYLWLPVKEATKSELGVIRLCPFKYTLIKPEYEKNCCGY